MPISPYPSNPAVVIHGATGAIGGAVAAAFAARGAQLFLTGRDEQKLLDLADRLDVISGSTVATVAIDAFDAEAVERHADEVAAVAGRIDVMLNAVSIPLVQGESLLKMALEDILAPSSSWMRTQVISARAAARHMSAAGGGTILTLSASPATVAIGGVGGFSAASAAIEALTRTLAAELGPAGVRAVCLRAQRILETLDGTPDLPMSVTDFRDFLESLTTSGTLPMLDDIARAAVYLGEGGSAAMNGSVLNLTCGMSPD